MKNIAHQIADLFDNDGTNFESFSGESLDDVCKSRGGRWKRRFDDARWDFEDGSSIVICVAGGAWDCGTTACWCWSDHEHNDGCTAR